MCQQIILPDGTAAIVCGGHARCSCGRSATLACDWKVPTNKSGTCDAAICTACTTSPAPDKDLCRLHAAAWRVWQAERVTRSTAA